MRYVYIFGEHKSTRKKKILPIFVFVPIFFFYLFIFTCEESVAGSVFGTSPFETKQTKTKTLNQDTANSNKYQSRKKKQ